jgi:hypothetical protein
MALNGVGARRRIVNHNRLSHFNFLSHSRSMQASIDIVDSMFEELCRTLTAGPAETASSGVTPLTYCRKHSWKG